MKKSYTIAGCEPVSCGFALLLDGKAARTPGGNPLTLPGRALAEAVAAEWHAQGGVIRRDTMPLTRMACIAIDLLSDSGGRARAAEELLAYAGTDLVCYRAGDNPTLLRSQAESLDPVLAWVEEKFAVTFAVTDGVIPVAQPAANGAKLAVALSGLDAWKLAALTAVAGPLGSLVLALALMEGRIDADAAFRLSHLEESFETEKWGRDEEKEAKLEGLRGEVAAVGYFLGLLKKES